MTTQRYERIPEWTQGDRLRKAREMIDMSQRAFAEHIGVMRHSSLATTAAYLGVDEDERQAAIRGLAA